MHHTTPGPIHARPPVIALIMVLLAGPLSLVCAAEAPLSGDITLMLPNAVWREKYGDRGGSDSRDLILGIIAKNGQFEPEVVGAGVAFTRSFHEGKITSSKIEGKEITIDLDMDIHTDWQVKGGKGHYTIKLTREGDLLRGTYQGTYRGRNVSGEVTGFVPRVFRDAAVSQMGDHPRLAFRKSDIDALRAAAKTPKGQAILARLSELLAQPMEEDPASHAAGHALLYLLDGQPRDAQAARAGVKYTLDRGLTHATYDAAGVQMIGVALAYDLCGHAWDDRFRWSVARALSHRSDTLLDFGEHSTTGFTQDPASPWQALARGGAGVCALAVLNDALGPLEDLGDPILRVVDPPASYRPGRGIVAEPLVFEKFPTTHWLYAGPFPRVSERKFAEAPPRDEFDHLIELGGRTNPTPPIEVGTQVTSRGVTRRFEKLPSDCLIADQNGHIRLDALEASNHQDNSVWYYFTVLHNDAVHYARFWEVYNDFPAIWIGGQRAHDNQPIKLNPGFIPLLLEVRIGDKPNYVSTSLYFHRSDQRDATSYARYLQDERNKGTMLTEPRLPRTVRVAKLPIMRFLDSPKPDETGLAEGAYPFLVAYRNTMGFDVAPPALRDYHLSQINKPHEAIFALAALLEGR
jgi:hypothetical protein